MPREPGASVSAGRGAGSGPGFRGHVTILNLDSAAHTAGVAIDGPISKNAAAHALQLIRFLRPDNDELTIYLNSSGGDVSAAIELGEEVRKLSVLTALDDHGECLGACVLVWPQACGGPP